MELLKVKEIIKSARQRYDIMGAEFSESQIVLDTIDENMSRVQRELEFLRSAVFDLTPSLSPLQYPESPQSRTI